jgi:putative ABC transport system permease protein
MLKNYIKIAFRNLWRHKIFSLINITGLAIGMTACILIYLYVSFELSYDSFHRKADRIYRVVADLKTPDEVISHNGPAWAVAPNIKDEFPEVRSFVRITNWNDIAVRKGDIKLIEKSITWADSSFFEVFDFGLLKGDPHTALKEPHTVVLSEKIARKYFGKTDPIGQTLQFADGSLTAKVTGIMKDIPENSQVKAELILSMTTITTEMATNLDSSWDNYGGYAYLLLTPGMDAKALERKFPAFLERRNGAAMKKAQMYPTLMLEPLRDVYLRSTRDGQKKENIANVYIFSVVAVFILLIACFNFINLTTARSADRAREVGVRKVVGAERWQLTKQFIGESLVICLIAFLLSIIFSSVLLPSFNQLAGKTISHSIFESVYCLAALFLAAVCVGVMAGVYPALVLSSYKPVVVLKGRYPGGSNGMWLRKALVVSQFAISIGLIIATIIVYNQMSYMRSRDLGFSRDQIMVMDTYGDPAKNAFRQVLSQMPAVKSVAMSANVPGSVNSSAYTEIENKKGVFQVTALDLYFVDYDYIDLFKMKVVAGRGFSKNFGTDSTQAMVLNESAVKLLGYSSPQEAIGKRYKQWGNEGEIIGVIKDFHFRSLQQQINPLSLRMSREYYNLLSVNISPVNLPATIAAIEKKWKELIPSWPFNYYFMDEFFDRQYRAEDRFGKLFLNFSILAILISCLGLVGLASYSAMQRTKEIGIRKVMGASVANIVGLLSKDFLKLLPIAALIAFPVAGFVMNNWLQDFAYRESLPWWAFVLAGVLATVVALFTIGFQAIKAAVANPVKSLRSE